MNQFLNQGFGLTQKESSDWKRNHPELGRRGVTIKQLKTRHGTPSSVERSP